MNLGNFLAELKRRNVYKVAITYGVVAWLLIQVASIILPTFEAPPWVMKGLVVFLALGFGLALFISWAFEATPQGLKRTENVPADANLPYWSRRKFIAFVLGVALIAAGLWVYQFYFGIHGTDGSSRSSAESEDHRTGANVPEKSIAVLPFESLSDDKANSYFATGIQDEILARLSRIADLKVISKTSTQQYKSAPGNLREIAHQLGVAHVLEGSVQKANDQVRVTVQLINASSDAHLWANTYDRKLTDIFAVESEIAKTIADQLQAKLTGREQQALTTKPTSNSEAYDAYLRGLAAEGQSLHSVYAMEEAVHFYEKAVQLDPEFAVAWSRLSRANSLVYSSPNDPTEARRDAAKRALEMAQKLQPNSAETLLAQAAYQFVVLDDYQLAKNTYRLISEMIPGNSEVPYALASIARQQRDWDAATAYFDQALVLDPRNVELLVSAASNYSDQRAFEVALKLYGQALDIQPNDPDLMALKAGILQAQGNLEEAAGLLREVNSETPSLVVFATKITQLRLERNLTEAVRLLKARVAQYHFGSELEKGAFTKDLAFAQRLAGDSVNANSTAKQARETLEPVCRNQPENVFAATCLSQAYAMLGDRDAALKEVQRAMALRPSVKDDLNENLAMVRTIIGNNSGAISILSGLSKVPYAEWGALYGIPITSALLRLDPAWDSLRGDPVFQKLYTEKSQ